MGLFDSFTDFFKSNKNDTQPETGLHLQNELIETIVIALQPFKLLKHDIIGLKIHLVPDSQKQVYDTLLGSADFKTNLQRNLESNDFDLPSNFSFGYQWCNALPTDYTTLGANRVLEVVKRDDIKTQATQTATITVLSGRGQLAESYYQLQPDQTRYNIGRSQNPMLDTGRLHTNQIVAIAADETGFDAIKGKPNLLVSRAHAYILYDGFKHQYCLYAYAGGLNIGQNSSKIFRGVDETIRLLIENHPYPLANNDQIELGGREGLLLKFNLN